MFWRLLLVYILGVLVVLVAARSVMVVVGVVAEGALRVGSSLVALVLATLQMTLTMLVADPTWK